MVFTGRPASVFRSRQRRRRAPSSARQPLAPSFDSFASLRLPSPASTMREAASPARLKEAPAGRNSRAPQQSALSSRAQKREGALDWGNSAVFPRGGMGERLIPAVLKTVVPERVPGVRIPLPPPVFVFGALEDDTEGLSICRIKTYSIRSAVRKRHLKPLCAPHGSL